MATGGRGDGSTGQQAWREALLEKLLLAVLPLATAALAIALLGFRGAPRTAISTLVVFDCALAAVTFARRIPYAIRAGTLVSMFAYATAVGYLTVGFQGNPAVLGATSVVLAALLFGRRATLLLLGGLALAPLAGATGMLSGLVPVPAPSQTALTVPLAWVRTSVITVVLWTTLGLAVTYVVANIENALRAERETLRDLQREQERRQRAEEQRLEAERGAAQAQKVELVGQLAAGIAHDFNNVLAVVQCWAELSLRDAANEEVRAEGYDGIVAATRQGAALSQKLLSFCRRNVRTVGAFDLTDAVDAMLKVLGRALPDDIQIVVEHGERAVVRVDELELQQIVLNLVINARDAMPGGGRLRVSTGVETVATARSVAGGELGPGRWGTITVEDSGVGIDASVRERIFEPFFTTKPVGVGTGLGLATVQSIARESGGCVALESRPGEGACFTVYLPEDREATATAADDVPRPSTTVRSSPAARILLVEDNAPIRDLMKTILERAGHTVTPAGDGHRALQAIRDHAFDLLCTDAVVPGEPVRVLIDAFETRHPAGRVLVVSGQVDEELTRRGIEQGRYRLLRKPFRAEALCAAVDEGLSSAPGRATA